MIVHYHYYAQEKGVTKNNLKEISCSMKHWQWRGTLSTVETKVELTSLFSSRGTLIVSSNTEICQKIGFELNVYHHWLARRQH